MPISLHWNSAELDSEMQLRLRPLREQWEARGPGMLAYIARQAPWLAEQVQLQVRLVNPSSHQLAQVLSADRIQLIAYLANPLQQLPEVVRIAWICCCARLPEAHAMSPVSTALIPLVLEAGEFVELVTYDEARVEQAVVHWMGDKSPTRAQQLYAWWRERGAQAIFDRDIWLRATVELARRPS